MFIQEPSSIFKMVKVSSRKKKKKDVGHTPAFTITEAALDGYNTFLDPPFNGTGIPRSWERLR